MNALADSDLIGLALGLAMSLVVGTVLGRGLSGMWAKERLVTQATVRMMRTTFLLVAAGLVCVEIVLLPARVPNPLCGLSDCSGAHVPTSAADVILIVATRFGGACIMVGMAYLVPVISGIRWRRRSGHTPPAA